MKHPDRRSFLLLGARHDPKLAHDVQLGVHPRADYLELIEQYGMTLMDFASVESRPVVGWISRRRFLGPYWALALASAREHSRGDRVVATGEDIGVRAMIVQQLLRRSKNRPTFSVVVHGSYLGSRKFRLLAKLLRRSPGVRWLCLSQAIAQQMLELGFPSDSTVVVGYGVDTAFFRPVEPSTGPRTSHDRIVSAGTANRDYQTLVDATRDAGVQVRIAADSAWFREDLNVVRASLPANIEVRSYGTYPALRDLYGSSAIVVVPLHEARRASGYAVILEAMAMGKPVVTTRISGMSDFIIDGETGVLVAPADSAELALAIGVLLSDYKRSHAIAERARQRVLTEFTVELYVRRIAEAAELECRA